MTNGKEEGVWEDLFDSNQNAYCLFDLSIGSFKASIALVWLQWEGVDG